MNTTTDNIRLADIRNVTFNGERRVCFTAYIMGHSAYIHLGQFSAPAGTPEDKLFQHIYTE
jgi:hypothetical protein